MRWIELTQGKATCVDDEDFELLNQYRWRYLKVRGGGYAITTITIGGKRKSCLMHRLLLGSPTNMEIDHEDGDGLNNQRSNLRVATSSQNRMNSVGHFDRKLESKGVCYLPDKRRFKAQIQRDGKKINLGLFKTEQEAFEAYKFAAKEMYGKFAWTGEE